MEGGVETACQVESKARGKFTILIKVDCFPQVMHRNSTERVGVFHREDGSFPQVRSRFPQPAT
jgi:hypothetical protein